MGLYFRHPSSLEHETGRHPENASRIRAIDAALESAGWPGLEQVEAPLADRELIERVHDAAHVERIERFCAAGGGMIDGDTIAVRASWEAALRAAGAAAAGAERILAGESDFAFSGMRPPGHHAESDRAMGFCLFNNAAVAAAHAIAACDVGKVLILDWDVHHGNGTNDIFHADPRVLFCSIHEWPLYPGSGSSADHGSGAGLGCTMNLPVPAGSGDAVFTAMVDHVVAPAARAYAPQLILVSAGYDAHADDPLAGCEVTDAGYAAMAASVRRLSAELAAPLGIVLEGGYDLGALSRGVLTTLETIGRDPGTLPDAPADPHPLALDAAQRVAGRLPA